MTVEREPMAPDPALLSEASAFLQTPEAGTVRLEIPRDRPRPVVLPTWRGTGFEPDLVALLALLLQRYGVPVLMHGPAAKTATAGSDTTSSDHGARVCDPVSTAAVLWELGIEPATSRADAQARLLHDGLAYVPLDVLAPGIVAFVAFVARRAQSRGQELLSLLATLIDPFGGDGFRVIGAASEADVALIRAHLVATRGDALLFCDAQGGPFADPRRQSRLEHIAAGVASVCVEAGATDAVSAPSLPTATEAATTAAWITQALAGSVPLPPSIVTLLGCCLNGARRQIAA
jgi:anthranilate phosphoribosyltransferase